MAAITGRGGAGDLQAAEPEQLHAHLPEHARLEFQADEEQHHDDAELGEVLDADDIDIEAAPEPG